MSTTYLMFYGATSFNQNLSNWDLSSMRGMRGMFWGAALFNQDIWLEYINGLNMDKLFREAPYPIKT